MVIHQTNVTNSSSFLHFISKRLSCVMTTISHGLHSSFYATVITMFSITVHLFLHPFPASCIMSILQEITCFILKCSVSTFLCIVSLTRSYFILWVNTVQLRFYCCFQDCIKSSCYQFTIWAQRLNTIKYVI